MLPCCQTNHKAAVRCEGHALHYIMVPECQRVVPSQIKPTEAKFDRSN